MKLFSFFKSKKELLKEIKDLKKQITQLEHELDQLSIDKLSLMSKVESLLNLISK